ncbi:MAG: hypothetical protein WCF13_07590 [Stellaceae bacterium]
MRVLVAAGAFVLAARLCSRDRGVTLIGTPLRRSVTAHDFRSILSSNTISWGPAWFGFSLPSSWC